MDIGEANKTNDTNNTNNTNNANNTNNTNSTDMNRTDTNRICPLKFIGNLTLPIQWAGCVRSRCAWFDQAAGKCSVASLCKAVRNI